MKNHYCDIIEFEKNQSFQEICDQRHSDEFQLEKCDKEIDIIVNESSLSLDNDSSDYYLQSPCRRNIPNSIQSFNRINSGVGWSLKEELLLKTWMKKSFGYRWLHSKSSTYYKTLDNWFTYPIVFISSVISMGGFALIGINPANAHETSMWEHILNYIIAFINLIVATLIMIQKVNKYAEKAESHRITATQYTKFYRGINLELSLEQNHVDTKQLCRKLKETYDDLLDNAPEIPTCVIDKFNIIYKNSVIKPDIIR